MDIKKQSPATVPKEQAAVQSTVGPFNNGMKPQGSTTPDSNSSTKETLTMEEKNLSVSASSVSTMEKTNSTMSGQPLNIIGAAPFDEGNAKVESPNADKEVEQNINNIIKMENQELIPATVPTDQATVENNYGLEPQGSTTPDSNSSTKERLIMEEKNLLTSPLSASIIQKESIEIAGELSSVDRDFCKKKTKQILDISSPKQFAKPMEACQIVDLSSAEEDGEIIIGKLDMNRKPKEKAINAMYGTILEVGAQIMCLVIPATVAVYFGYRITDFEGNPIPKNELYRTVVIIDGQTRYSAILKIRKEYPDKKAPRLYAYFPLHWVSLDRMLQAINLKVFTWSNSDFMTGVLSNTNVSEAVRTTLEYIQRLEARGYNYTAACELITLSKGIIRKPPLVKAMSEESPSLNYPYSEFGLEIHKVAVMKFSGKNEKALQSKTVPELMIDAWEKSCKELSQKEATQYIIAFLNQLEDNEVKEIVSPSGYKRGCGKKKEVFVKEQFEKSFQAFLKDNPYTQFKNGQDEE